MLLRLEGLEKRFGGVVALRRGDLQIRPGEVHLLMGENGAGKSTMMKIVAGMQKRDSGRMEWNGQPVDFGSPKEASQMGIAMVHQESLLAPQLSVAENIFLGREPLGRFGLVDRQRMRTEAAKIIAEHNFPLQAEAMVEKLSPAGRQLVEICRAIHHGSSLIIFDEPTSSLSEGETHEVFKIVRKLRDSGKSVIYITHRMEELRSVGDHVTILRDGETVHTQELATLSTKQMIHYMVGREVNSIFRRQALPPGEPRLTIRGLNTPSLLRDINLTVRAGEVVALAGLIGAGRTELCRAIFGIDPISAGEIVVNGKPCTIRKPRQAVEAGMALIPEDRGRAGLARELPIAWNVTMPMLDQVSPNGFIQFDRENSITTDAIARLRIRCEGGQQKAGRLSGGNQQKVVISKWVARGANVFLFDEPTRGIDIGAKVEVFEVMDELAKQGAAILMVSSELPEVLAVADRILVMRQGRISGELPGDATQEQIMHLAALESSTPPPASSPSLQ